MNSQIDLENYKCRLDKLRSRCCSHTENKHLLCSNLIFMTKSLNEKVFDEYCTKVINKDGDADFVMISLIRLLYLTKIHSSLIQTNLVNHIIEKVLNCLDKFPFWPNIGKPSGMPDDMVFWSENHIFMLLTTHYLLKQFQQSYENNISSTNGDRISIHNNNNNNHDILLNNLLKTYIQTHLKFNSTCNSKGFSTSCGVYEVLSHVYLPYTLSALLNMFDFCDDFELKIQINKLIDCIITQLLLVTSSQGISNLSVSNRAFLRTRIRNHNHNINQLIQLFSDQIIDNNPCFQITDFLLTTTWEPCIRHFEAYTWNGFLQITMNHHVDHTRSLFLETATEVGLLVVINNGYNGNTNNSNNNNNNTVTTNTTFTTNTTITNSSSSGTATTLSSHKMSVLVDPIEIVPFFWSAGLISHPHFIRDTQRYQDLKQLQHNCHLWPLRMLPTSVVRSLLKSYHHFSRGQDYTGVTLNVYKSKTDGLLLTSFQTPADRPSFCGFQQLPWIANISGIGVWSQSGDGTEKISQFGLTNTHSPYLAQNQTILIIYYSAPSALTATLGLSSNMFSYKVRMFWPRLVFDEEYCMFHQSEGYEEVIGGKNHHHHHHDSSSSSSSSSSSTSKESSFMSMASRISNSFSSSSSSSSSSCKDNKRLWRVAKYKSCYIGILCSEVTIEDSSGSADSTIEVMDDHGNIRRLASTQLICRVPTHFWVVKVGTVQEFPNISRFMESCVSMKIKYEENQSRRVNITLINNSNNNTIQSTTTATATTTMNSDENFPNDSSFITKLNCLRPD